jgi:hypothetical protein
MGGTDDLDNLVEVTVEQHALLHKQLWEDLGHWQDEIAWKTLSGQMTKQDAIIESIKKANTGRKLSNETRKKMSLSRTGKKRKPRTLEHARNIGLANKGRKATEQQNLNNSLAQIGKTLNTEHRQKIGSANRGKQRIQVTCPHCKKTGANNMMTRWHFDNCRVGGIV